MKFTMPNISRRGNVLLSISAAFGVAAVLGLSGCSSTHQSAPDPTGGNIVNMTHAKIIQEPNGYRNVSFGCLGTTGIYDTSRGDPAVASLSSSVAVLPNDPQCVS